MTATNVLGLCSLLAALSAPAYAQPSDEIPPTPPVPPGAEDGPETYAGVGSDVAYSEAGVVELGGNLAFSAGGGSTSIAADPFLGYFLWDNIQASIIVGTRWASVDGNSATRFSVVLEPSFHYPFNRYVFAFAGIGGGFGMASPEIDDIGFGVAVAPRAGMQFLVGRSGLINVGLRQVLTFVDANDSIDPYQGRTVLAFTNSFDGQVGYTVMF